ncbi:MAG TPA: peptide chain release factor N(5)-glutamine methyltransferase [Candidatus Acidoferrales bacterium]|nr:peptide chain release factor N(5)-glutamine methyltransferase [Candidatus Acidoferrales bacterium]
MAQAQKVEPQVMDVRATLREGIARLRAAKVPSDALAAELLLMHALGRDRTWLYSYPETPLEPAATLKYFALIARRAAGEPTQYLTGKQEFWGLEFEVNPAVLIPRPETEHVIEVALERLGARGTAAPMRIADVGTGSGCIAVALARELPQAELFGTDISAAALEVAARNAARHGVSDRIHFINCDLLSGVADSETQFDLIVSNPPYVARDDAGQLQREVREHEPAEALFGGPTGGEMYSRLIAEAGPLLRIGGILVLELGYNSAPHVSTLLTPHLGWNNVKIANDLAGIPRVIAAKRT